MNSVREQAAEAVRAVGTAIFPQFKRDQKGRCFTDFADVARLRQVGKVRWSRLVGQDSGSERHQRRLGEQAKRCSARSRDKGLEHCIGL